MPLYADMISSYNDAAIAMTNPLLIPPTTKSPDPKTELPLMVLIFVPEINVACLPDNAVAVAVDIGLLASEVLSTFPMPISVLSRTMFEERAFEFTVLVNG